MITPIDYSILAEPFPQMYKIHRYWGRKPWNIYGDYIKRYTVPGDIILDPFVGSGLSVAEAIKRERKIVAIDLNPMAEIITRQLITPIDLLSFEHVFNDIVRAVEEVFKAEYLTKCRKCGTKSHVIHYKWERPPIEKGSKLIDAEKRKLTSLTYTCPNCDIISQPPNKQDYAAIKKPYLKLIPDYLKNKELILNRPSEAKYYFDLFTPRNLFLLSVIYDEILKISDVEIKKIMTLVFTSTLTQSSRLIMYTERGIRPGMHERSKSWIAPRFHIQRKYLEKNPLINFQNSFNTIMRAKQQSNKSIKNCSFVDNFDDLVKGKGNVFLIKDDVGFIDKLPINSIDYIIADPPFAEDIRYLELSQIWLNWLDEETEFDKEIRILPKQKGSKKQYKDKLISAFEKMFRVLKKNKQLTVTYQTDELSFWDTMVSSPVHAGFHLSNLVPQGVAYSTGAKYRALMKDKKQKLIHGYFYLTYSKNKGTARKDNSSNFSNRIIDFTINLLKDRNEETPLIFILINLYETLNRQEILQYSVTGIIDILDKSNDLKRLSDSKNPLWEKWSLKRKDLYDSSQSLENLIKNDLEEVLLYKSERPNDYIKYILSKYKGRSIVSSQRVNRILENISNKDNNEMLTLAANKKSIADRKRSEIINDLIKLGETFNFDSLHLSSNMPTNTLTNDIKEIIEPFYNSQYKHILLWIKNKKPAIMFYITLTGAKPFKKTELLNEKISAVVPGFQRLMIIPYTPEESFIKEIQHWDYILLENLEQLMFDKNVINKITVKSKHKTTRHLLKKSIKAEVRNIIQYKVEDEVRYFKLVLNGSYIQQNAQPGQFVNILIPTKKNKKNLVFDTDKTYMTHLSKSRHQHQAKTLLRRPFSIHRIYYEGFDPNKLKGKRKLPDEFTPFMEGGKKTLFDILIKVVGKGTKTLSNLRIGDKLDIIGPLGTPININPSLSTALIVAGGIGIAPLYALAEKLRWQNKKVVLFHGVYDEDDLKMLQLGEEYGMDSLEANRLVQEFKDMDIDVKICNEKGKDESIFTKGLITQEFNNYLDDNSKSLENTEVFSCGPKAMLKSIVNIASKHNLTHHVLLEEKMGCGLGGCMTCVCPTKSNKSIEYKRICMEGPTFDAKEIAWDKYN